MTVTPASEATPTTPLAAELVGRLRGHGPLPFAGYMARCLYDPHLGYYTRGLNFATTSGADFTTAPALSPLFGATLAEWVSNAWQQLHQPVPFTLIEAGPGGGQLMHALLTHLQQAHPACYQAARLHLLEVSPTLTLQQQQHLQGFPVQWHTDLASLPTNAPVILLGNEVLDAFPVDVYTHTQQIWLRRCLGLDDHDALQLIDRPVRTPPPLPPGWQPADDAVLEVPTGLHTWLAALRQYMSTTGGQLLLIDYGYADLPPAGGETVQALYRHQPVSLLHRPGEADLTAHVHFGWTAALLGHPLTSASTLSRLTDLAPFLMANGLLKLAEPTITDPVTQGVLQRLLHPARMGRLFKALHVTFLS